MAHILFIYSSTDGHTREICERLKQTTEELGDRITLVSIDEANTVDLDTIDKIVLGASIRYGKHNDRVYQFVEARLSELQQKPSAFFSVNLVARKPNKRTAQTNPYVKKFLQQIRWQPANIAIFAGKLDYPRYGFWDRNIIRLIMLITKGPTDPSLTVDFTDWEQVNDFAHLVHNM